MPQPGDIGLVSIKGITGWLIRVGQWINGDGYANYEHAFIMVDPDTLVEAEPSGAIHTTFTDRPVLWIHCPARYRRAVADAALELVGTPYSFADYLAIAAVRLHIPSRALRRYVTSSKHMICSQLVDEAARRGGWDLFTDGRLPQDVTPGDLWQLTKETP